jgi:LysR family hydrogen peroxide-inducible transcriptional activator
MATLPTPQQLRYLVSLAEHGHFGRAAAACSVTQSTLSGGVLALERQLGVRLLERSTRARAVFTPLGLEVLERARAALVALEAVAEVAEAAHAPMSGPLRLGVIPTIGPFLLPALMPVLRERFPRLRLYLREDMTASLVAQLAAGKLDLLLLALPAELGGAESLPVFDDAFVLALPPGHPLAARTQVPVAALAAERLLLLEDGHCLRTHALEACGLAGRRDGEGFAATSLHTVVQMVAGGLGVSLLPRLAVDRGVLAGAEVVLRPLSAPQPARSIGLAWRRRSPRAAEFRALAGTVRDAANAGAPASRAA